MIRLVLVEDNPEAIILLKNIICNYFQELEIIAHFTNVEEAYPFIKENKFDWLMLDIELEGNMNGFDLLDLLGNYRPFKLIFFTGNTDKTLEAIRVEAFDYLTKPLSIKDLRNTIERYKSQIENQKNDTSELKNNRVLKVNTHQKTFYIKLEDIKYLKADGAYTLIYYLGNNEVRCSKNMTTISKQLDDNFIRVSRSLSINKNHLIMIEKLEDGTSNIKLSEGGIVNISYRVRKHLTSIIKQ